MTDQWPVPQTPPSPALPSVDDLPVVERGYDTARVEEAFDAFYRHIARLDATLRTLEAVEVFSRQAAELRAELRAMRARGWEQDWSFAYNRPLAPARPGIPPALPRLAAEAAFLIAVAVFLGVGGFRATTIVLVMAAAWAIIGLVEWLVSRDRTPVFTAPAAVPPPEEPVVGWPDEEPAEDDALTMMAELEPSRRRRFRRGAGAAKS